MDIELALKRLLTLNEIQPGDLKAHYVPRPDQPMDRISVLLRGPSRQQKFILTGQHGCGKSTELNQLAATMAEDYRVVRGGHEELRIVQDPVDVEFLFVLLRILLRETASLDPELHQNTVAKFDKYMGQDRVVDLHTKLSMMGVTVSAGPRMPSISQQEAAVREEFRTFGSELFSIVTTTITEIETFSQKPVLLIIDDIEKLRYTQVHELLKEHSYLLSSLPCAAIYTAPHAILFDSTLFLGIGDNFHSVNLANVPIHNKKEQIELTQDFLAQVIKSRVETSYYAIGADSASLGILFLASGGNLRQWLRLVGSALFFAYQDGDEKIGRQHALRTIQDGERDYRRIVSFEEREIIKRVFETKEYDHTMPLDLLASLCVLEYWHPTWSTWYDANPLVYGLIGKRSPATRLTEREQHA